MVGAAVRISAARFRYGSRWRGVHRLRTLFLGQKHGQQQEQQHDQQLPIDTVKWWCELGCVLYVHCRMKRASPSLRRKAEEERKKARD